MLTCTAGQGLFIAEQEVVGGGVEPRGLRVSDASARWEAWRQRQLRAVKGGELESREEVTRAGRPRSFGPPARGSGEGIGACPRGFEADSERGLLRVEKAGQLRNDHV